MSGAERRLADTGHLLRHHPYGEGSAVLSVLTATRGKQRLDMKGARTAKRPRGAAFEPLTRVRIAWQPGRELGRIEELAVEHSPLASVRGYWQGAFLEFAAGLLDALCPDNEPLPGHHRLAAAAAGPLLAAPDWAAVIYLEFFALHLGGWLPDLAACPRCGRAAAALRIGPSSASCDECGEGGARLVRFAGEPLQFLRALRRTPPSGLAALCAGRALPPLEAPLAVLLGAALEREIPGRALLIELLRRPSRA